MKTLIILVALLAGCSKSKEPPPATQPSGAPTADAAPAIASPSWYRATLGAKEGTPIPFFLNIPPTGDEAFIATGPDRVRAKLVSRPPKLVLEFDILRTKIEATARPDGVLEGSFQSTSGSWGNATLGFAAEPIEKLDPALRFPGAAAGPDPVGIWKVTFPDQTAKLTVAKGEGSELTANLLFQTGNQAFLAGIQQGKTLRFSAFDGASPYLLVAEVDEAGKQLEGMWTAGQALAWKEEITGTKGADFQVDLQTTLATARAKLKVPQLEKAPYAGKPVIVELGGSWCPACGHASEKLRELKDKYGKDGLEILMLAYEFTDDPEYNKTQAAHFKSKYKIPWEVVPVDGGLEKYNEILPAALQNIDASGFPITIFVARDGGIEGFHSGFPPKAWGKPHEHALSEYDRLAAKIVASKAR